MSEQDQIVSNAAYILFYQRRGINFEQIDYEQLRNRLEIVSGDNSSAEVASQSPKPAEQCMPAKQTSPDEITIDLRSGKKTITRFQPSSN